MFVEPGGVAIEKSVPIPVRAIACGAPGALSAMVIEPFRVPVAVGVNVRLMVQLAPAATMVPFLQVVPAAGAKSPLGSTLVMVSMVVPPFVSVTTWVRLVVLRGRLPKSKLVLDRLRAGPEGVPVPIKLITWGLPPALSVMMIAPARAPMAVGAKLALIVQLALAATLPPFAQVVPVAGMKSPLRTMLVMVSAALPVLVSVAVCAALNVPSGWLANVRLSVDSLTAGPVSTALPVRLIFCGLSAALSVMLIVPVKRPGIVGVKVTLMVQLAPAARLLPQLLVWKKFKLATMPAMVRVALPLFISVTAIGRLLVPTVWLPVSERLGGIRVTTGAAPVPARVIVRGLPLPLSVMVTVPVLVPRAVGVKVTLMVQPEPEATLLPQVFV